MVVDNTFMNMYVAIFELLETVLLYIKIIFDIHDQINMYATFDFTWRVVLILFM